MLPKTFRLRKKSEFSQVLKRGQSKSENRLTLRVLQNGLTVSRFGFLVSKKNFPKAVQRNRVRRQLREIVRQFLGQIKAGQDVVVIMSKEGPKEFLSLKESLHSLFKKADLIQK